MITEIKTDYDYLLHLIFSVLNDRAPIEKPEHISFSNVFQHGVKHYVANIAYYGIERLSHKPEAELLYQWKKECDEWVLKDIHQKLARSEIVKLLKEKNIPFIEAQGTVVKNYYPQSDFRTMSDIDFIVSIDDLPKTKGIFKQLGYAPENIGELEIDAIRKPDIFVEMHSDFFYNGDYAKIMPNAFDCCIESDNRLTDEYFYLYNFLHFCKHYFGRGCGIRNVIDIYLLNKQLLSQINYNFVLDKLSELKLVEFYEQISDLANMWFDKAIKYKTKHTEIEEYLFECGIYGTSNIALKNSFKKQRDNGVHFVRFRYIWKLIFLTREQIAKKYNIRKHKTLLYLPLSLYRIIHALFTKLDYIFSTLKVIIKN